VAIFAQYKSNAFIAAKEGTCAEIRLLLAGTSDMELMGINYELTPAVSLGSRRHTSIPFRPSFFVCALRLEIATNCIFPGGRRPPRQKISQLYVQSYKING